MIRKYYLIFVFLIMTAIGCLVSFAIINNHVSHGVGILNGWIWDPSTGLTSLVEGAGPPESLRGLNEAKLDELANSGHWVVVRPQNHGPKDRVILFPTLFNPPIFYMKAVIPIVAACVLMCGLCILAYLFRQGKVARRVIQEIESGNLRARLPEDKLIGFQSVVTAFNKMADTIVSLVEKLRTAERSRTEIVQELAHDIRTPLTSLQLTIEDICQNVQSMHEVEVIKAGQLCLSELEYLNRIIEGLLLIAQLEEPNYRAHERVSPVQTLAREIQACRASDDGKGLEWRLEETSNKLEIFGEDFLLSRVFRNLLQNASHYAKSRIWVKVQVLGPHSSLLIRIQDDGPGFSEEQLAQFGTRRSSRIVGTTIKSKISLGMGSAVARKIVERLGGRLEASNWSGGGQVSLQLPLAPAKSPPLSKAA